MFLKAKHRWLTHEAGGVNRQPHKALRPPVTAGVHGASGGKSESLGLRARCPVPELRLSISAGGTPALEQGCLGSLPPLASLSHTGSLWRNNSSMCFSDCCCRRCGPSLTSLLNWLQFFCFMFGVLALRHLFSRTRDGTRTPCFGG